MITSNDSTKLHHEDHQRLENDLAASFNAFADGLVKGMNESFDAIDDTLFDLANNARSNNEQNRYFETMRELRLKRRSIETSFRNGVVTGFEEIETLKATESPSCSSEALSLVDNTDLEQRLALETMTNKAEVACQGASLTLDRRIAQFYDTEFKANSPASNPASPAHIVSLLGQCTSDLEIGLKELLLLYKHFDKHMLSALPDLSEKLDSNLAQAGILRELSHQELRRKGLSTASEKHRPLPGQQKTTSNLNQSSPSPSQSRATTRATSVASIDELFKTIDAIDLQLFTKHAANNPLSLSEMTQRIESELSSSFNKQISKNHVDIINLVALLFEYILNDQHIASDLRALIGRLQLPVLKIVLKDPDFFNLQMHPARAYLDRLANAATGWNGSSEHAFAKFLPELKQSVDFVVANCDQGISIFSEADQRLAAFLDREDKRRELIEARTKRTQEGRIKSRVAQKHVDTCLSNLVNGKTNIPQSILQLLDGPWRRVMFLAYLRDADQHNWEHSKKIAEELIWCTQHHTSETDRQKWVSVVPRLLKQIAVELNMISFSTEDSAKQLERVRKSLADLFRDSSLSNQTPSKPMFKRLRKQSEDASAKENKKVTASDSNISGFQVGQWFELINEQGIKQRYKLVSHISEADVYVFVDRRGLAPVEKNTAQLIDELNQNRIKLLDRGSAIDRAIAQMMKNLQR